MDITGKIYHIGKEQKVSDSFRKLEFIIEDNSSKYTQHFLLQVTQDRIDLLDPYDVGDEVKVHYNLRGKLWTSKDGKQTAFNSLEAWKLERVGSASNTKQEDHYDHPSAHSSPADDLPF